MISEKLAFDFCREEWLLAFRNRRGSQNEGQGEKKEQKEDKGQKRQSNHRSAKKTKTPIFWTTKFFVSKHRPEKVRTQNPWISHRRKQKELPTLSLELHHGMSNSDKLWGYIF